MNVIFLSPAFPPTAHLLCAALRARQVSVLGVGDEPLSDDREERRALSEYAFEPEMADYAVLHRSVARLRDRHGVIHRIDSNGERWLDFEARLREDFDVPGLRPAALARQRSKLGMAEIFAAAGIPHPPGIRASSVKGVREFANVHGFPLIFKPDTGSGAIRTFTVQSHEELELALEAPLDAHIVQPFIEGEIVTFDGLADGDGRIVFSTSHVYDQGIMQVRLGRLDGYYYSLRDIPFELQSLGARALAAFDVRERFFHLEFFARPGGSYVALEMNLRPPGGFTTDMINYACEIDVYALWAAAITGESLTGFSYERKYHTAHAGRRTERRYRLPHDVLLRELGPALVLHRPIPAAFADTMGDTMYLLRHAELDPLKRAIALVQDV